MQKENCAEDHNILPHARFPCYLLALLLAGQRYTTGKKAILYKDDISR